MPVVLATPAMTAPAAWSNRHMAGANPGNGNLPRYSRDGVQYGA